MAEEKQKKRKGLGTHQGEPRKKPKKPKKDE